MPILICSTYDGTCEECRLGRARPHNYKKWSSPTGWCDEPGTGEVVTP